MQKKLNEIIKTAKEAVDKSASVSEINENRVRFLGKKGEITAMMKELGKLPADAKKEAGQITNAARSKVEKLIAEKMKTLKEAEKKRKLEAEKIDVTAPSKRRKVGVKHPITQVINEVVDIFKSLGYSVYEGPEIDTVFNTFDGLNSPETHPARDMTDTFYVKEDVVLRPHTSSAEIRAEQELRPPYKIIIPGRTFRCDTPDATHNHTFHQIELMVVGEEITMADLKGTLDYMAKRLFGPQTKTQFRPHHFPFTEPSAEMDVSCFKCGGSGCNVCKGSGWIEILGCGITHPHVHQSGGIDTEKYTGFAAGMGVERIAMLKYGIDDIRLLYENDMRFIEQFK